MITRIVCLEFQTDYLEDFLRIFAANRARIITFEGCHNLELKRDFEAPNRLFTISLWDNIETLEHYRSSDFFQETWKKVKPFFSARPLAWSLENQPY